MGPAMYISQLDDDSKRRLLRAVADRGKASGIEAVAKIIAEMANHKGRVVGTNELRDLVEMLHGKASEIRASAEAEIAALEKQR